jgi:cytidylate kinase
VGFVSNTIIILTVRSSTAIFLDHGTEMLLPGPLAVYGPVLPELPFTNFNLIYFMRSIRPRAKDISRRKPAMVENISVDINSASAISRWRSLLFCITFDGTAASGKSAICRNVATFFDALHINSGLMFRYVAWRLLQERISGDVEDVLLFRARAIARETHFVFKRQDDGKSRLYVNKELLIENTIGDETVANLASIIAKDAIVREVVRSVQRSHVESNERIVLEGRDAGTRVVPDAFMKFYIDCQLDIRASRRLSKEEFLGEAEVTFEGVKSVLKTRDERDMKREQDPLIQTESMHYIDNSLETAKQSSSRVRKMIQAKLLEKRFVLKF